MNTVAVSLPHLPDGASVIVTGSTAGLMPGTADNPIMGPGGAGYGWSKRVLVQYVEQMALQLASRVIRVNAIHPTNCKTHLVHNEGHYTLFSPDLAGDGQTVRREGAEPAFHALPAMHAHRTETEEAGPQETG